MRAMKKMLISAAACGVLAAAVSASALCAQIDVTDGATYAQDSSGNYTVSVDASRMLTQNSGQMTVMVTKAGALEKGLKNDDILYIDQVASADGIFKNMGVKGKLEAGATYDVFVGGSDVKSGNEAAFYRTSFTVAADNTLNWGDIDGNKKVELADATLLLYHVSNIQMLSYTDAELKTVGDMNKDDKVELADATLLLYHVSNIQKIAGLPDSYGSTITAEAE